MSILKFEHHVSVWNLSYIERYDAAGWAFEHFGQDHVNVFVTEQTDTFCFERSEDAVLFALKWAK